MSDNQASFVVDGLCVWLASYLETFNERYTYFKFPSNSLSKTSQREKLWSTLDCIVYLLVVQIIADAIEHWVQVLVESFNLKAANFEIFLDQLIIFLKPLSQSTKIFIFLSVSNILSISSRQVFEASFQRERQVLVREIRFLLLLQPNDMIHIQRLHYRGTNKLKQHVLSALLTVLEL